MMDRDTLVQAVDGTSSIAEVLAALGLRAAGGNYTAIKRAASLHHVDLPVFEKGSSHPTFAKKRPDSEVFVVDSDYNHRDLVKKRLYAMGVPRQCRKCGVGESWQGQPLTLTLEHINGVWNDNRLENLEILCPNCHSQTATFAGRSRRLSNFCCDCGDPIKRGSSRCISCGQRRRWDAEVKERYPPLPKLIAFVEVHGYCAAGRTIGVSDNAVRKHIETRKALLAAQRDRHPASGAVPER